MAIRQDGDSGAAQAPAPALAVLRFGRCEADLARRELRLDGEIQPLPAKVYELLVLLVQQRHRVVPKPELIDAVWLHAAVSDSILARTVMQARRAIGDSTEQPRWIKTVHGVGYRFVGDVLSSNKAAEALAYRTLQRRIGVLPCDNETGDNSLDWARLGLMALVGHALEADPRLAVVPTSALLEAVDRLPPSALAEERAQLAIEALGLHYVAHAVIRRQGQEGLWLDYRLFDPAHMLLSGSLRDAEAVTLGERFAQIINSALFPHAESTIEFASQDDFSNQTFARSIELVNKEQYHSAARLLAVVCDMEPDSLLARLWLLQALTRTLDPQALVVGEDLLERAIRDGNPKYRALAHAGLAQATRMIPSESSPERCRRHLAEMRALTRGRESEDWVIQIHLRSAMEAQFHGDRSDALALYEGIEQTCRSNGNAVTLAIVAGNLAEFDAAAGDLNSAKQRLEEALRINRMLRREGAKLYALTSLAVVNAGLGLLDLAFVQCKEATDSLDTSQDPPARAVAAANIMTVYAERCATEDMRSILARTADLADVRSPFHPVRLVAEAFVAWCGGAAAQASRMVRQALDRSRADGNNVHARRLMVLLLHIDVARADVDSMRALVQEAMAFPDYPTDHELQGSVLRAQAADHFNHGRPVVALGLLDALTAQVPFGRLQACARLDAAWLCLEAGDPVRAEQLLEGAGAWRDQHPTGQSTDARLKFALGRHQEALTLQQRALAGFRGSAPPWQQQLLQSYAAAAGDTAALITPPRLPVLASDSWWPRSPSSLDTDKP